MIFDKDLLNYSYHSMEAEDVLEFLETSLDGLTDDEAENRKTILGLNQLETTKKRSLFRRFLQQLQNFMVYILAGAAAIALIVGDTKSTVIILVVININAILGMIQENKAEKSLEALQDLSSPEAEVIRSGKATMVRSEDLTLGDIVILEAGDHIPADLRIIEAANLKIEEASLTGESVPVEKTSQKMEQEESVIGDRKNMAYMGSSISYGRAIGVVCAVGMDTEMGKIADYLNATPSHQETPLQKKLAEMSKFISIIILFVSLVIFATGLLWGRGAFEMFLTAVSLAVAAIPEGLPAIVTIVLALGVQRMAEKNAIVRKLPAVETLGSTQVICTDKTGTLTRNVMTVVKFFYNGQSSDSCCENDPDEVRKELLAGMTLCNDVRVKRNDDGDLLMNGDPTETAMVKAADDLGIDKNNAEKALPRVMEIPFDSDRKLMTTVHFTGNRYKAYTKGALDILLSRCSTLYENGQITSLDEDSGKRILEANRSMTSNALRIIGFAFREFDERPDSLRPDDIESSLTFIGFIGMIDPPRPEVRHAVEICRSAGIKPVMITGDHRDTAAAIAKDLGILAQGDIVIEGTAIEKMSDTELREQVSHCSVFARVSPEHKVRIVNAWKQNDKITAMTGDGVNDAPALKAADISVGMGITGTDVAKGVSDIVLADDNFATIVSAVEEGRKIYGNIRKAVKFLLSTHLGEVAALFIATLLNWTMLYPIHLLWVNLIIDTLPALALGLEHPEKDIMKRAPRDSRQNFFAEGLGIAILIQGAMKGALILCAYYIALKMHGQEVAVTTAFLTLGFVQLAHTFSLRSDTNSIFKTHFFTNRYLLAAVAIAVFLQAIVVIAAPLNPIFSIQQLYWQEWLVSIFASIMIIPFTELYKYIVNK